MNNSLYAMLFTAALAVPTAPVTAQGADPAKEIQELARRVGEQLEQIDRLLLESSRKNQPRATPTEKLQQAHTTSDAVQTGIDELIDKLNEMKNQSGGGQSQDQQQQQQQQQQDQQQQGQQQQQQGRQQRRENETPDFVQQPKEGQQPGEQPSGQQPGERPDGQQPGQQQQPQNGNPNGTQQGNDPGQNTTGNRQLEPDLGPGQKGTGEAGWGELQDYVNFLKNRGSPPKVPEKFRKYWEAYLKNKRGSGN